MQETTDGRDGSFHILFSRVPEVIWGHLSCYLCKTDYSLQYFLSLRGGELSGFQTYELFLCICKMSELFIHSEEKCTIIIVDTESSHVGVSADNSGSEI